MEDQRLSFGVSAIVPVYNSQQTLGELVRRLEHALNGEDRPYEIILVDDGSRDASWNAIETLAARHPAVRGLRLMRNFGQHNALVCGLRAARYDVAVTLDDDLQHPPEAIPTLLARLAAGDDHADYDQRADVVYGAPARRPHAWWRNLTSAIAKGAMARGLGNPNIAQLSAFRALRTRLRAAFADFKSPRCSLDLLLSWGTSRFASVPVEHQPRRVGRSNYNFLKLLDVTLVTMTSYSTTPLRLASLVGFLFTLFGGVTLGYVLVRTLIEGSLPGFPFLASVVCLFSGAQMFTLGIMGEYLARMYTRSQDRPTYIVGQQTDGDETCSREPARTAASVLTADEQEALTAGRLGGDVVFFRQSGGEG